MQIVHQSVVFSHSLVPAPLLLAPPPIAGLLPASISHHHATETLPITLSFEVNLPDAHADLLRAALQPLVEASAAYLREESQPWVIRRASAAFLTRLEASRPQDTLVHADHSPSRAKTEASAGYQLAKLRAGYQSKEELDAELAPLADSLLQAFQVSYDAHGKRAAS